MDLGTGTGVIAIIAAKYGHTVRATEVDPEAHRIATENIDRNDVEGLVVVTQKNAVTSRVDSTDLVVANVTLGVHRQISANYANADRIIVAGILCNQVGKMGELLPEHTSTTISTRGEWAAIDFSRAE